MAVVFGQSHDGGAVWFTWQPALPGLESSECMAYRARDFCMLFLDLKWSSSVSASRVEWHLPSNVRTSVTCTATVVLIDCTELEIPRVSHGHVVIEGDLCVVHTHGWFVEDRKYRVCGQVACKLLV